MLLACLPERLGKYCVDAWFFVCFKCSTKRELSYLKTNDRGHLPIQLNQIAETGGTEL